MKNEIFLILGLAVLQISCFKVECGENNMLPFEMNTTENIDSSDNSIVGRPFRKMAIYPYRIYEYQESGNSI